MLGAWQNRKTERYEPPSKSVIYRVLEQTNPAVLEAVLQHHAAPRIQLGSALATDRTRIREASRNETVTLVDHETGLPLASLGFHDGNGEIAVVRAVLEMARLDGKVITVDARHTVRDIARLIVEDHSAQYLMMVKARAERTFATLTGLHWDQQSTGFHEDPEERAHGQVERHGIRTLIPPPGTVNYPQIRQIVRIQIDRRHVKTGDRSQEIIYGLTSVPEQPGSPQRLLDWSRGHGTVEDQNHRPCSTTLCNWSAVAVILHEGRTIADRKRHSYPDRKAVPGPG